MALKNLLPGIGVPSPASASKADAVFFIIGRQILASKEASYKFYERNLILAFMPS